MRGNKGARQRDVRGALESEDGETRRKLQFLRVVEGSDRRGSVEKRRERRQERWTKMGEERGRGREREESHEAASLQYFIC